jgi:glycosyltransferase involved in cell wall biosynthesis
MGERPLLTLTSIVKDEAHTIAHTLASARRHIDRWCILDTGSTDGTQACILDAMRGIPGALHEEPFVDFATTRNRGLDLCGTRTEFILWLDADDELENGDALRSFLEQERPSTAADAEAYSVRVETPGASFDSARVLRSRSSWRFRGAVHEVLTHPDRSAPARRVPGVAVRHAPGAAGAARSRARWERDVDLLQREVERDPGASRAAFYLAMTLLWLERHDEAIAAFDRRIRLAGWGEEVFYARLSKARAADRAGRAWPEVLVLYLEAHASAPHRAEPLYDLAMHYDRTNDHALAFLFARRAYELPFPAADTLFVEENVYRWGVPDLVGTHAYWLGEVEIGERAARQAAAAVPADTRMARNVEFYEARKAEKTSKT